MNEKVILLARQRSGTHALKSILQSHPDFHCFEEIFHADPAFRTCPENFFRFIEEQQLPATALLPWNIETTLDDFWAHLNHLAEGKRFQVLDVKYNSTHWMPREWQSLDQLPHFFEYIRKQNMKVILLTRENALRQLISGEIAARQRVWEVSCNTQNIPKSIRMDPEALLWQLRGIRDEDALIERALWQYDVLRFEYIDLFLQPDGCVPHAAIEQICDYLDVPNLFARHPRCAKQLPLPLSELIENYAEVTAALEPTEFRWMLRDERQWNGVNK